MKYESGDIINYNNKYVMVLDFKIYNDMMKNLNIATYMNNTTHIIACDLHNLHYVNMLFYYLSLEHEIKLISKSNNLTKLVWNL
jgi:hypothetical protein